MSESRAREIFRFAGRIRIAFALFPHTCEIMCAAGLRNGTGRLCRYVDVIYMIALWFFFASSGIGFVTHLSNFGLILVTQTQTIV